MICVCLTVSHSRCRHTTVDLDLPASFLPLITFHKPVKAVHRHAQPHKLSSETVACRKENMKRNRKGKKNLQEKEQKGLNRLPDITSHLTPTHHDLSWVQALEEIWGFFQDSRQGEDHKSSPQPMKITKAYPTLRKQLETNILWG